MISDNASAGNNAADLSDRANFENLKVDGQLSQPEDAASKVLNFLVKADFGKTPVADIKD